MFSSFTAPHSGWFVLVALFAATCFVVFACFVIWPAKGRPTFFVAVVLVGAAAYFTGVVALMGARDRDEALIRTLEAKYRAQLDRHVPFPDGIDRKGGWFKVNLVKNEVTQCRLSDTDQLLCQKPSKALATAELGSSTHAQSRSRKP